MREVDRNDGAEAGSAGGTISGQVQDFVHGKLSNGRRYKMLTVLDEYTRQALAVKVGTRMTAGDVLEVIYRLSRQL